MSAGKVVADGHASLPLEGPHRNPATAVKAGKVAVAVECTLSDGPTPLYAATPVAATPTVVKEGKLMTLFEATSIFVARSRFGAAYVTPPTLGTTPFPLHVPLRCVKPVRSIVYVLERLSWMFPFQCVTPGPSVNDVTVTPGGVYHRLRSPFALVPLTSVHAGPPAAVVVVSVLGVHAAALQ